MVNLKIVISYAFEWNGLCPTTKRCMTDITRNVIAYYEIINHPSSEKCQEFVQTLNEKRILHKTPVKKDNAVYSVYFVKSPEGNIIQAYYAPHEIAL